MKITIVKINNYLVQISKTKHGIMINQILLLTQIFSNHKLETIKHDKQDIIQHHKIITFKILKKHKYINQVKCKMKTHYHIIYKRINKNTTWNFSQIPNAAELLQMTLNP